MSSFFHDLLVIIGWIVGFLFVAILVTLFMRGLGFLLPKRWREPYVSWLLGSKTESASVPPSEETTILSTEQPEEASVHSNDRQLDISSKSFDELMDIAERGFLDNIDDSTRVECLRQAAEIAKHEGDITKKLFVNALYLEFKERGIVK